MSPALPLRLDPAPGESWHSYLTRRAAQHHCTVTDLADSIGLRRSGRWPAYHGTIIAPSLRDDVAPRLSLAGHVIDDMHLARYDQQAFDLTGLLHEPGIGATRAVAARHWTWLAGSTYCPACLSDDGIWRLAWRLPWITTCTTHEVALVGYCPDCRGIAGLSNTLHASAPHRVAAAPDGRRCTRPSGAGTCGTDLTRTTTHRVTIARRSRTALLTQVIDTGHGVVLGRRVTALQALTAWQAAIGIAVRWGIADSGEAQAWGRTHRQINPPRDPALIDQLLGVVEPLITAPTPAAGADVLEEWCRRAGMTSPHRDTFARITRPSAALQPGVDELLARHGRGHARLNRLLTAADGRPLVDLGYTSDDVPQLAWPCTLPPAWRASRKPDQRILRVVVSMALVRAVNGGDWITVGASLGIPADKARNWTRYAFSSRFGTLRADLIDAAVRTTRKLAAAPGSGTWQRRPYITGYGLTSLNCAQQPACAATQPETWCPCVS